MLRYAITFFIIALSSPQRLNCVQLDLFSEVLQEGASQMIRMKWS